MTVISHINILILISLLVDQGVPEGTCSQVLQLTLVCSV